MLDKVLEFIRGAGAFALENQKEIDFATSKLKSARNSDVVTKTDLEISRTVYCLRTEIYRRFS